MLKHLILSTFLLTGTYSTGNPIRTTDGQRLTGWGDRSENLGYKSSVYRGNERDKGLLGRDYTTHEPPRKHARITAWGILAIILCLVGVGVGVHYVIFCYPVLCKKQRRYDTMQMTDV